MLRFTNLNASDVTFSRSGVHVKIAINSTGQTITLDEQLYSSSANWGIERVEFADGTSWDRAQIKTAAWIRGTNGDDTLSGTNDNDTFIGGTGDDRVNSGAGSDTYIYAAGDGNDYIDDESGSTADVDVLRFSDLNASDVTFSRSGVHVKVVVNSTGQTITLDEQLYSSSANWGIERVEFADGTSWDRAQIKDAAWIRGTNGDDTLNGTDGADTLSGGVGNDALLGGSGDDVYRYASGDGSDSIDDSAGSADRLVFADLTASDVQLLVVGTDLKIGVLGTGESIVDKGHFSSSTRGIDQITFSDGTVWSRSDIATHAAA